MAASKVDRGFVKMVAFKRLLTGSLGLVSGVVLIVLFALRGSSPTPMLGVALLFFWGGGAWALRDGFRLWRALSEG